MSDQLLQQAKAKRDEIKQKLDELSRLESELEEIEDFISLSERMAEKLGVRTGGNLKLNIPKVPPPPPKSAWVNNDTAQTYTDKVISTIEDIMRNEKRPMRPMEIVNILKMKGLHINGKNPNGTLSAMLSNAKGKFKSLPNRVGWVLADGASLSTRQSEIEL